MDTDKYSTTSPVLPAYNTAVSGIPSGLMPVETPQNAQYYPESGPRGSSNGAIHPVAGFKNPVPDHQPVYPIKIESSVGYQNVDPMAGPGPQPKKGWVVPRRWLVLLIIIAVVAVIVAIVVPVVIVVGRQKSADPAPAPVITTSAPPPEPNGSTGGSFPISTPISTPSYTTSSSSSTPYITPPTYLDTPPTGYHTLYLSYKTTTGTNNLCSRQWWNVPYTYTVYPSITSSSGYYTAYWKISGYSAYSTTVSDWTGSPTSSGSVTMWRFIESLDFSYGSCDMEGFDSLEYTEDGDVIYVQKLSVVDTSCSISSTRFYGTETCTVSFRGYWT